MFQEYSATSWFSKPSDSVKREDLGEGCSHRGTAHHQTANKKKKKTNKKKKNAQVFRLKKKTE